MRYKGRILVVDDEEIVRIKISRVLAKAGFKVTQVASGVDALAILEKGAIDLVVSDMVLEDTDGLSLLKKVRRKHPKIIFLILTGHGSLATAIESMRLGAFDYLLKPCDDQELVFRIQRGLKEYRLLKKVESQTLRLKKMAITDGLTGAYSRSYFMETLDREFKSFQRYRAPLSFLMIDIDHFKRINDCLGHQKGDEVLHRIAVQFQKTIREADILGRYGGEEFGIIQPKTDSRGALITAQRILSVLAEDQSLHSTLKGKRLHVTVSIGIASCPHPEISNSTLLINKADTALYEAKRAGRNRAVLYGALPEEDLLEKEAH